MTSNTSNATPDVSTFHEYTPEELEGTFGAIMEYRIFPRADRKINAVDYDIVKGTIELEYATEEEKEALPDNTFLPVAEWLLGGFAPDREAWFSFVSGGLAVAPTGELYHGFDVRNSATMAPMSERALVGTVWMPLLKVTGTAGDKNDAGGEFSYVRPDMGVLKIDADTESLAKQYSDERAEALKKMKSMLWRVRRSVDKMICEYENPTGTKRGDVWFGPDLVAWSTKTRWAPAADLPPNLRRADDSNHDAGWVLDPHPDLPDDE